MGQWNRCIGSVVFLVAFLSCPCDAQSDLSVSTFTITAQTDSEARVNIVEGIESYSFVLTPQGTFQIRHGEQPVLEIDHNGNLTALENVFAMKNVEAAHYIVGGVAQWRLFSFDDFSADARGWSNDSRTSCDGQKILGGHCQFARGEVTRTFNNLPLHNHIQVKARLHLLGSWQGQSAYFKVDGGYVFSEVYDHNFVNEAKSISICEGKTAEGKFGVPIDVIVPHTQGGVKVAIGSTLDGDPCDHSWGIGSMELYTR
eukprot:gnl/Spiro4/23907_TR11831_c0_g1_i1.p1 gnl/Spiro4/23907_TR11831_c0_g1~~gnl/Spiro4/23907_TR11831_c0_g1_i1.p1  ORF type:complete len:268 (+),score=50.03 gnl/Spiro4/23907_TR11831_c0_g1_i1:36-806(+)